MRFCCSRVSDSSSRFPRRFPLLVVVPPLSPTEQTPLRTNTHNFSTVILYCVCWLTRDNADFSYSDRIGASGVSSQVLLDSSGNSCSGSLTLSKLQESYFDQRLCVCVCEWEAVTSPRPVGRAVLTLSSRSHSLFKTDGQGQSKWNIPHVSCLV